MRGIANIMGSALTMASVVSCTSILLPLYEWPADNTTWSAVYNAAAAHPAIHFRIIVNPDSGPGDTTYPESGYIDGVSQLNSYSNIEVLGYVHTEYATRDISVIESQISTYSGWSSYKKQNITISGIFFDEAPSSDDSTLVSYMQEVSNTAKSNNLNTIVFNPGTKVQDDAYFKAADLIVEFENSYSSWLSSIPANEFTNTAGYSQGAVILYSAPLSSDYESVLQEVDQMGLGAAYLTNTDDYKNANSVTKVASALKLATGEASSSSSSSSISSTSSSSSISFSTALVTSSATVSWSSFSSTSTSVLTSTFLGTTSASQSTTALPSPFSSVSDSPSQWTSAPPAASQTTPPPPPPPPPAWGSGSCPHYIG